MTAPPVLVTGGAGFLGSAVVRRLLERGREVHVLARATTDRAPLAGLDVRWHEADLTEPDQVARAVEAFASAAWAGGAAGDVVHAAALISYRTADAEAARKVNVEGTRLLLDACQTQGVGRFLFVSSVVAVGHAASARAVLDEEAPFNGGALRAHYVTTKRAAEDFVLAVARQVDAVVVNPAAIFGPARSPSNTTRFLQRVATGGLGPFAPPGSLSVVGVEDAAEGVVLALERGARGRRYLLSESSWTLAELLRLAADELGARPPRLRVPPSLWRLVVLGAGLVDHARALELSTPQALRLLGVHYRFDARRAREELGWSPRPFTEVLSDTVAWMRREGLVTA